MELGTPVVHRSVRKTAINLVLGLALLMSSVSASADNTATTGARDGYDTTVAALIRGDFNAILTRAVGNMDVDRHDAIVAAIKSGDPAQAESSVREHMAWAVANLI